MKIAAFLPNWVGDACMATPALQALKQSPGVSELVLIGKPGPIGVLEGTPFAEHVITYKPRSRSTHLHSRRGVIRELRKGRFDVIVLFPNSLSSALIAYFSGIPRRIGFDRDGRGFLLTDRIRVRDGAIDWRKRPTIDYYIELTRAVGNTSQNRQMILAVKEDDHALFDQMMGHLSLNRDLPLVVINNASATAVSRLWPEQFAVEIARELASRDIQVLFHSGPADREQNKRMVLAASHPLVQSMGDFDPIPLGLSRAVMANANVVLSTDSGPRHIAVALNRPVVTLFGSTSTELTQTYNIPETKISLPLECRPCLKETCPLKHHRCMKDLRPNQVLKAILERLGSDTLQLRK